jgi:hypothetical protein
MQVEGQHKGSNTWVATGKRVRNTYTTFLSVGDSLWKRRLIPHKTGALHGDIVKDLSPEDGCAAD